MRWKDSDVKVQPFNGRCVWPGQHTSTICELKIDTRFLFSKQQKRALPRQELMKGPCRFQQPSGSSVQFSGLGIRAWIVPCGDTRSTSPKPQPKLQLDPGGVIDCQLVAAPVART